MGTNQGTHHACKACKAWLNSLSWQQQTAVMMWTSGADHDAYQVSCAGQGHTTTQCPGAQLGPVAPHLGMILEEWYQPLEEGMSGKAGRRGQWGRLG